MYVQQARPVWTRDEALASVDQVLFADLPLPGSVYVPEARQPLSMADHATLSFLSIKVSIPVSVSLCRCCFVELSIFEEPRQPLSMADPKTRHLCVQAQLTTA